MSLTLSRVMNRVKARLGVAVQKLELTDEDLARIIMEETLPTFSNFFPEFKSHKIYRHEKLEDHGGTYYIRGLEERTILGMSRILGGGCTSGQGLGNRNGYGRHNEFRRNVTPETGVRSFMMDQAAANVVSALMHPYTFEFKPPNSILLQPFMDEDYIDVELKMVHASLMTIHPGLTEYFCKLALYDIQIDLLGIRSYFQNISTTYGEINLRLDSLEQADDKREELLELFREKASFSPNRQQIWVY